MKNGHDNLNLRHFHHHIIIIITVSSQASRDKMLKHYTKEITHHVKLLHDTLMQHDALLKQVMLTVETHDDKFTKHEQRIGDLEKIANSQLIWRIDEYSK